ncbi:NUDIX hydrolase [Ideonella sp. DXS22W]|uniref:Phosphatase NudJ n=1 Tax=Pseudaquabacterium inlustre TaxID=2984192 RepID=A0ABU9CIE1_9BURK
MTDSRWKPSVTVAAIVSRNDPDGPRYLLVEEMTPEGLRLNNPAGHLDPGESPQQAAARECLEETACAFVPQALVGVYLSRFQRGERLVDGLPRPAEDITFVRFAYCGSVGEPEPGRALDAPIVRTLWLTPDEVRASVARHRSPLLLQCIEDHLAGKRLPLDAVTTHASVHGAVR